MGKGLFFLIYLYLNLVNRCLPNDYMSTLKSNPQKLSGDANNDKRCGKRTLAPLDMVEDAQKVVALIG